MFGADQREARHTPKHQPFLGWFFSGPPTDAREFDTPVWPTLIV